ncbi:MAG: glycosyltransferase, partial [Chloroflexota bacterium]|nr:glycosyltransferase [Chloroflexota bacterium]
MKHQPRVTIGLPVYNGENYLTTALDAILAQTYTDFTLVISDNASTDRTQAICLAYAAADKRIRYMRNAVNWGAAPNFSRVCELATGEYFMWAAHDDIMAPDLLARCVEVLDQDATVVLCHAQIKIIDAQGEVITAYDDALKLHRIGSQQPHQRFRDLIMIP